MVEFSHVKLGDEEEVVSLKSLMPGGASWVEMGVEKEGFWDWSRSRCRIISWMLENVSTRYAIVDWLTY